MAYPNSWWRTDPWWSNEGWWHNGSWGTDPWWSNEGWWNNGSWGSGYSRPQSPSTTSRKNYLFKKGVPNTIKKINQSGNQYQ
jgi:hypothetical protein